MLMPQKLPPEVDNGETDEDSEETDQGDGTKAVVIID